LFQLLLQRFALLLKISVLLLKRLLTLRDSFAVLFQLGAACIKQRAKFLVAMLTLFNIAFSRVQQFLLVLLLIVPQGLLQPLRFQILFRLADLFAGLVQLDFSALKRLEALSQRGDLFVLHTPGFADALKLTIYIRNDPQNIIACAGLAGCIIHRLGVWRRFNRSFSGSTIAWAMVLVVFTRLSMLIGFRWTRFRAEMWVIHNVVPWKWFE
jgi:hypothetical protein